MTVRYRRNVFASTPLRGMKDVAYRGRASCYYIQYSRRILAAIIRSPPIYTTAVLLLLKMSRNRLIAQRRQSKEELLAHFRAETGREAIITASAICREGINQEIPGTSVRSSQSVSSSFYTRKRDLCHALMLRYSTGRRGVIDDVFVAHPTPGPRYYVCMLEL